MTLNSLNESAPIVLVVDHDVRSQDALRVTLEKQFMIVTASSATEARGLLQRQPISVILCEQRIPEITGVGFLKEVRAQWPDIVRMIILSCTDSENIIAGIHEAGLFRYILKPWSPDHLIQSVSNAAQAHASQRRTSRIKPALRAGTSALCLPTAKQMTPSRSIFGFDRILRTPESLLDHVCRMAERAAHYNIPVLVLGESGTGKELLARAIHYASPRQSGPFVVENCAALPDTLLESELFGHKRGSFTGAFEDHQGLFQRANGGTVFLDEIGETSPAFQVKLLRVLQEGEVRPIGAVRPVPVDVRIISATNRNLEKCVRDGQFREDLYYRLSAVSLTVPPLRERVDDIPHIVRQIVQDVAVELSHPGAKIPAETLDCLMAYAWPGNIRELRNEIGRALALHDGGELLPAAFSPRVLQGCVIDTDSNLTAAFPTSGSLTERLNVIEAMVLREALLRHHWNKTRVAAELGLSRVGLRAKIQRLGLDRS